MKLSRPIIFEPKTATAAPHKTATTRSLRMGQPRFCRGAGRGVWARPYGYGMSRLGAGKKRLKLKARNRLLSPILRSIAMDRSSREERDPERCAVVHEFNVRIPSENSLPGEGGEEGRERDAVVIFDLRLMRFWPSIERHRR